MEKYGLRGEAAKMVQEVATAFRFIDDILDEHDTRWEKPARWVETSPVEALAEAEILTTKALKRAERLGCRKEFLEMFEAVLDAVYYEIDVEEGRAEFISEEDWKRAAGREAHFRAFIGYLKGEDPVKYYQEGLKAQMKDDVMGAEKGERGEYGRAFEASAVAKNQGRGIMCRREKTKIPTMKTKLESRNCWNLYI